MAEVVLEDVVKVYPGDVVAVDHVSLNIADREFVVLVGPSGCGKSTTLRMVAGLEDISNGTIRIGDRVVNEVAPKDRDIAMVFQNYALYPHMSVYKNMAFGLMMRRRHSFWGNPFQWFASGDYRRKAKEEREAIDNSVRDAARLLGIEHLLERRPRALSGGQRQRVAVGRAIVREPKAFLFDEPLSNLDAKLRVEMRAELKRLHRQVQTTTIYVTHDQEEAMTLGDRVVVMKDGIIQQVGTPFEVYQEPVNRFVASFVGTPPMNFLDGRLEKDGDQLAFVSGEDRLPVSQRHADLLAGSVGQDVVLGIRPEGLEPAQGDSAAAIHAHVSVVEPLGDRMDVYAMLNEDHRIIARISAHAEVDENAPIALKVDMDHAHFFESGEAGANLTQREKQTAAAS